MEIAKGRLGCAQVDGLGFPSAVLLLLLAKYSGCMPGYRHLNGHESVVVLRSQSLESGPCLLLDDAGGAGLTTRFGALIGLGLHCKTSSLVCRFRGKSPIMSSHVVLHLDWPS